MSCSSYSDNGTQADTAKYATSPSIFPMRIVIAWLNELSVLSQIQKLSIQIKDHMSALLLTECNLAICQSIRILELHWPGGYRNDAYFFRQFVNVQHLVLKIPNEYLRKIQFNVMSQLQVLELTTDYIYNNDEPSEHQSYSEFNCSIGNDSDNNFCRGIDYTQLQLSQQKRLKHLIIYYQFKNKYKQVQPGPNANASDHPYSNKVNSNTNTLMLPNNSQPTAVLYSSLIPGFDEGATSQNLIPQCFQQEIINFGNLPNVEKITIYADEIFKLIDQSVIDRNPLGNRTQLINNAFINPNTFQLTLPCPQFSYGLFKHIEAGPETKNAQQNMPNQTPIYNQNNMFRTGRVNDTLEEEQMRKEGAIRGYSMIRLVEQNPQFNRNPNSPIKEDDQSQQYYQKPYLGHEKWQKPKMMVNIYFKKMQFNFNFKVNYKTF